MNGLKQLLNDPRGTFSILILLVSSIAVLLGKIDGLSYSGIMGIIATIYNVSQHRVEVELAKQNNSPQPQDPEVGNR